MYNLKRVLNLVGTERLIEAINKMAVLPVEKEYRHFIYCPI
jgi:hypothetical protein